MRRLTALLLGTLILLIAVPGAARASTEPVTWSITPATADGPDDRVSVRLELEAGSEHRDHLAVTNYSEREVTFDLTAADGVVSEAGEFGLRPDTEPTTGAGGWLDLPGEVTVPAGESVVVPFTVTVPEDALPGDHPAGVAATLASTQEGVGLDAGVGLRLHLRVAGDVVPRVDVTDVSASYTTSWNPLEPGTLDVEWTVTNTGNVRLGSAQRLEVLGLLGLDPGVATEVRGEQRELLPGQSASVSAAVDAWPLGRLTARVVAEQQVVGDDAVDVALPTAVAETSTTAVPWPHALAAAALVLAVVVVLLRRRRQRRRLAQALAAARADGARESALTV